MLTLLITHPVTPGQLGMVGVCVHYLLALIVCVSAVSSLPLICLC